MALGTFQATVKKIEEEPTKTISSIDGTETILPQTYAITWIIEALDPSEVVMRGVDAETAQAMLLAWANGKNVYNINAPTLAN
jgi:hypothetical protein